MRQSLFACIHAMLSLLLPVCDEYGPQNEM